MIRWILNCLLSFFFISCSVQQQISKLARENVLENTAMKTAHVGISVYDPAEDKTLYDYQGEKYFVPASNTKLFSLYAGMKYLGDSLIGIRYIETDTAIFILPSGDPSLLHGDYKRQPVIDFLKSITKKIYVANINWDEQALGAGWSWDDYNDDYMVERSALPVYGNVIKWVEEKQKQQQDSSFDPSPVVYSIPEVNWKVKFTTDSKQKNFFVKRKRDENVFDITQGNETLKSQEVPFITNGISSAIELLKDTVGREIYVTNKVPSDDKPQLRIKLSHVGAAFSQELNDAEEMHIIHSQPVDSLFVPMMYRSEIFLRSRSYLWLPMKNWVL